MMRLAGRRDFTSGKDLRWRVMGDERTYEMWFFESRGARTE